MSTESRRGARTPVSGRFSPYACPSTSQGNNSSQEWSSLLNLVDLLELVYRRVGGPGRPLNKCFTLSTYLLATLAHLKAMCSWGPRMAGVSDEGLLILPSTRECHRLNFVGLLRVTEASDGGCQIKELIACPGTPGWPSPSSSFSQFGKPTAEVKKKKNLFFHGYNSNQ